METIELKFNNELISFEKNQRDVMVNATQMAKVFGKDVFQFTRIDSTKEFINSCLKPQFCGLLGVKSEEDLIVSTQKSGTWMHRVLALKFAAWLNPDFELWVYLKIDEILYEYAKTQENIMERTVKLKNDIKKKKELLEATNNEYKQIKLLEDELEQVKAERNNSTRKKFKEVYDLFNQPENN